MSTPLSVLVIDPDTPAARGLEQCLLACERLSVAFHHQPDPAVALRRLARLEADVIFIDNAMPAVTGREVIAAARNAGEQRPIIATSDEDCGYLAVDLMQAGADAFLCKRDLAPAFVQSVIDKALAAARKRNAQVKLRQDAIRGMITPTRTMALR